MRAMRKRGHHMELICRPEAQLVARMRDEGFVVHTVPMGGIVNFVKEVAAIRRILIDGRFDVLNTHSRKDTLIAALAGRLAGTPRPEERRAGTGRGTRAAGARSER